MLWWVTCQFSTTTRQSTRISFMKYLFHSDFFSSCFVSVCRFFSLREACRSLSLQLFTANLSTAQWGVKMFLTHHFSFVVSPVAFIVIYISALYLFWVLQAMVYLVNTLVSFSLFLFLLSLVLLSVSKEREVCVFPFAWLGILEDAY